MGPSLEYSKVGLSDTGALVVYTDTDMITAFPQASELFNATPMPTACFIITLSLFSTLDIVAEWPSVISARPRILVQATPGQDGIILGLKIGIRREDRVCRLPAQNQAVYY